MNTIDFNGMASKYGLDAAFVQQLHEKVVDKENFARAVKMFADGTLPFDVATGDAPINVASIRYDVAVNMWNARKIRAERVKEQMEMQRRIVEYYNGCKRITMAHPKDTRIRETVFIKDGIIVAFGHFEPNQGGIYMADNEVMPNFNWNPHETLKRFRNHDRAFFKAIKKHATKEPLSMFIFDERTIRKGK